MIEILNENFLKIDILRKYTFAQYTNKFREIGTFKINARLVEENLYLLKKQDMYVLFDGRILGKIEDVKKESDSEFEQTLELSGRLENVLFTKRVVAGTIKFKGNTAQLIKSVIENEITKDKNSNRYIDIDIKYDNESYLNSICSKVEKEITGGYIWDSIQPVMEQDSLGIYFLPIVSTKHKNSEGLDTNISSWELYISAGKNRTKKNRKNETPVVFSQSLSNIARTDYEYNTESYCNVAYVAGEGEGTERKWYEIKRTSEEEKGWKRNELWVDARDIQSVDEEGNEITKQEYEELIKQRSSEKFTEASKEESYEATITEANKQYKYGTDYVLGDLVTIVDNELKIETDAQITEVTRTIEGVREIVDIAFTYGKVNRDPVEQIKGNLNRTEQNRNDIKYIENKIEEVKDKINYEYIWLRSSNVMSSVNGIVKDYSIVNKRGNCFSYDILSSGNIVIGENAEYVRVMAKVSGSVQNTRGWGSLYHERDGEILSRITNVEYGDYVTVQLNAIYNVRKGDKLYMGYDEFARLNADGLVSDYFVEKIC